MVPSLLDVIRLADMYQVGRDELAGDLLREANCGKAALQSTRRKCLCERLGHPPQLDAGAGN